ncbi:MAG: c-type cytochrome domain-containing protein, partial [Novipirellula sp. JB048]
MGASTVVASAAGAAIDFNRDIRPLLSSRCVACHGPDEEQRAAGLRLDTEAGSRADLGGYVAIQPGDPEQSEILARLASDDEEMRMPPQGKGDPFSAEEIELVRRWIEQGAHYANHWSYEKPTRPALPQVEQVEWIRNP